MRPWPGLAAEVLMSMCVSMETMAPASATTVSPSLTPISVTTPAPTVRPPSRIANRSPFRPRQHTTLQRRLLKHHVCPDQTRHRWNRNPARHSHLAGRHSSARPEECRGFLPIPPVRSVSSHHLACHTLRVSIPSATVDALKANPPVATVSVTTRPEPDPDDRRSTDCSWKSSRRGQ